MTQKLRVIFVLFLMVMMPFSAKALSFRSLNAKNLAILSELPGSLAFKGTVEKIEDANGVRKVTFQVSDALNSVTRAGETLTLQFPLSDASGLKVTGGFPAPRFTLHENVVLFVTTNAKGNHFLIGGEQSHFKVTQVGSEERVTNSFKNSNFLNGIQSKTLNRQPQSLQSDGTLPYSVFKAILNENKK